MRKYKFEWILFGAGVFVAVVFYFIHHQLLSALYGDSGALGPLFTIVYPAGVLGSVDMDMFSKKTWIFWTMEMGILNGLLYVAAGIIVRAVFHIFSRKH